jgi:5-(carboxyamino)imidazole ribonucleotide synthase
MHSPPLTLGILGGGQLARMTAQAAQRLGVRVAILDAAPGSPAAQVTPLEFVGRWQDAGAVRRFAAACDVVTLENEFIDAEVLAALEAEGKPVHPGAAAVARIQDKLVQKQVLARAQLAVAPFAPVAAAADALACGREFGYPFLLKARRDAYDGNGNRTVRAPEEVGPAMEALGYPARALYAERHVPFRAELATLVARGRDGDTRSYPLVESRQERHICKWVLAPARVDGRIRALAGELARAAAETVGAVGIVGVELFLGPEDAVLINELAPRPHNTGHYSIEACATSQFENHVRAVLGWPLGDPDLIVPAAAMVNLLGRREGPARLDDLPAALGRGRAKLHLYGKAESRVGRKLGHVTVVGDDADACLREALAVDAALTL